MKLRPYQQEAVMKTMPYIGSGKNPLIAMPTGSGKSLVISEIVRLCRLDITRKVLIISHVKEILEQNKKSIDSHLDCISGMHSAMLNSFDIDDITVAGIQSIFRKPNLFLDFDIIIIDEAHLISNSQTTMYQKFLSGIGDYTCIGLTATPFRLDSGYIYGKDRLFHEVSYDLSSSDNFMKLVDDGYLCKLTTKRTKLEMDTTGIRLRGGDFNESQLAERFNVTKVTNEAIKEIIAAGVNRKKWLVFAIDISHAEHIAETLIRNGIKTAVIHSKMKESGFDRNKTIKDYKDGTYRCAVNVNILTTGFDSPDIDLIALLRPTNSPVLHVQTLGRGSRPSEQKDNCLILDFAGNTNRLGAINDVLVIKKGKGLGGGEPITKVCPECDEILPPAVKLCPECGHEFLFQHGLSANAIDVDVIDSGRPNWLPVISTSYEVKSNPLSPSTVKVTYECGNKRISEWICVEHKGFAKHKADHWIKYRGGAKCDTAEEVVRQSGSLMQPKEILVQKKFKYYTVNDSRF